jgi:xanthine dehydrogenase accessory factor
MDADVLGRAAALAEAREPFALATVVWRRAPTSGHVGAKAIVLADGTVEGWLGGACTEPTVVAQSRAAMADGQPRLVFLGRPDELDRRAADGMVTVPMTCDSEGAIQVYLEPVLPQPQVVVIGATPAAAALAALARTIGWDVAEIGAGEPADLGSLGIGGASAIVVATQGRADDAALEAVLATPAGYVGLVASAKRAAGTLEELRQRGVDEEQLARVMAPAGLDLGPIDNAEIAVAVLADLVARRAAGQLAAVPDVEPAEPTHCCH